MTKARTFAAHLAIGAFVLMNFAAPSVLDLVPIALAGTAGWVKIIGILCCWPMC